MGAMPGNRKERLSNRVSELEKINSGVGKLEIVETDRSFNESQANRKGSEVHSESETCKRISKQTVQEYLNVNKQLQKIHN